MTDDMYVVARITDLSDALTFTATKDGKSVVKTYDLSRLVLEEA